MVVVLTSLVARRWFRAAWSRHARAFTIMVLLPVWLCGGSFRDVVAVVEGQAEAEKAKPSPAPAADLSNLESRIAALKPSQAVSGGARFVPVTLLGYDLRAPRDERGVPHVIAGATYGLVLYFEIKEPGDLNFDVVVKIGEMYVWRQRIHIAKACPGDVVKKEINLRIPVTAPAGDTATSFSVLDTEVPTLAEGGTVIIEHQRTPLVSSKRDPTCMCWVKGNMVPNPSFEDNPHDPNWTPAEWRKLFGYSQVIDNCDAHCGTRSLMVDFHGGIDVSAWSVSGVEVKVTPGKKYKFGFFFKTKDLPAVPEGMRGPCLEIWDAKNRLEGMALYDLALPDAPTEWTASTERILAIPEGTTSIRLRIRRYGWMDQPSDWANPINTYPAGGTVWMDCLWLIPTK